MKDITFYNKIPFEKVSMRNQGKVLFVDYINIHTERESISIW